MTINIEIFPKYRVAYVRQVGPYGSANIQAMERLKKWAAKKNLLKSAIILGIPQDNPETTPPESCRYDACIVISKDYQIDDSIEENELAEGKYVICKVKHTGEDVQRAWTHIGTFLENTQYQIDNKPVVERYSFEMINNGYCELCVPIIS
ncbi:GyrI-like domain-containing protein [Salipaludibacillus agaradhaerens]|uniref:GyrI-like domain-containing protein n=1 Tax=Salipaludibacillus agaradhaerens TaxID=76935 RepID=A0A9Q4FY49_SALAG|nr:GyrI-like domain-containing protein [Salipaludibacillus agaradhaerens]MCR6097290.1 GyrI-like domain-containing protein [Salipaludibacillus agaradhaerens]MCR6113225.1 GyrI-like domain-containing protein [Salipaludibacillus agaradhaerens]